ncbi:MAG: Ig-like domain-containing protein [Intestinibaculum porci]|uniref:Ig-like domain-containing protein n=1 Tax=Intestinibaculum porci TaxID=2487118 RepID=UPI003F0A54F4
MKLKKLFAGVLTASMILNGGMTVSFAKKKSVSKITLNKKKVKLKKGKKFTLKLKGTKKSAKASVSNKKIIKLSAVKKSKKKVKNQWIVKALKAGKAKITVKAGKHKYVCKVTVLDINKAMNSHTSSTVSASQDSDVANNAIAAINGLPSAEYLTLNDEGRVQQAQNSYDSLTANQKQYVDTETVTKLNNCINKMNELKQQQAQQQVIESANTNTKLFFTDTIKSVDMMPGDTEKLSYSLSSSYYHDSDVKFTSSNSQVATVDSSGTVTGVGKGTAIITVAVGSLSDQYTVNVHDISITFPQLPKSLNDFSISERQIKCEIDSLSIEKHFYEPNEFSVRLNYTGKKLYDSTNSNDYCRIDYKLYNENNVVVDSGSIFSNNVNAGESFSGYTYLGSTLPEGSYRLELFDGQ